MFSAHFIKLVLDNPIYCGKLAYGRRNKLYDKFTDAEKKEFLNSFIERVDIYEQEQPDGRFLKHIKFRFPVYFNGKEIEEMSWDNETTVECVALLQKVK